MRALGAIAGAAVAVVAIGAWSCSSDAPPAMESARANEPAEEAVSQEAPQRAGRDGEAPADSPTMGGETSEGQIQPRGDDPSIDPALPGWARDAQSLRFVRGAVAETDRLLVEAGCTHCDVGAWAIGAWTGEGSAYELFVNTNGWRQAGDDGPFAFVSCVHACAVEGAPSMLDRTLYTSADGMHWDAHDLPAGDWTVVAMDGDGRIVLERTEQDGAYRWQRRVAERIEWPGLSPLPITPPPSGVRAGGHEWTAMQLPDDPERRVTMLLRDGRVLHDFSPYAISDMVATDADDGVLLSLRCPLRHAVRTEFERAGCHRLFASHAVLLEVSGGGDIVASYLVDLSPLQPVESDQGPDGPGLRGLTWRRSELWAVSALVYPSVTFRPARIDLAAGVFVSFSEPGAARDWVTAVRLDAPEASTAFSASGCVVLRVMPSREAEAVDGGTCVVGGRLTGDTATDAMGEEWVFVRGDGVGGWAVVG